MQNFSSGYLEFLWWGGGVGFRCITEFKPRLKLGFWLGLDCDKKRPHFRLILASRSIWVKSLRAGNLAFKWQKSAAHFIKLLGQFFMN